MRIGILSDTHDRTPQVIWCLASCAAGVTTVIHCGDIEGPQIVELFSGFTAHFVYGNCDSERGTLRTAIERIGATLHEPFGELVLDGKKLGFLHGDDRVLWRDLENSGYFDYLFHGHTHVAEDRRVGPTRIINPGALHRANPKTFVILDLATENLKSLIFPQD